MQHKGGVGLFLDKWEMFVRDGVELGGGGFMSTVEGLSVYFTHGTTTTKPRIIRAVQSPLRSSDVVWGTSITVLPVVDFFACKTNA